MQGEAAGAKEVDNWDWKHDHNEERDIECMSSNHLKFSIDYYSSVSGPPRLGVVVVIVSYSVIRTTPETGSSITSMIVSSKTAAFCLGGFLGAIFATVFRGRLFGVPRFAAFLREGWSLGFPRFETLRESLERCFPRFATFLRVARRFFALTIAVFLLPPSNRRDNIPQQFATPLLILRPQRDIKIPRPFPPSRTAVHPRIQYSSATP